MGNPKHVPVPKPQDKPSTYTPLLDEASRNDAGSEARKPNKAHIAIFCGLLLVVFLAALVASDNKDGSESNDCFVRKYGDGTSLSASGGDAEMKMEKVKPAASRGKSEGVSEKTNGLFLSGGESVPGFQWNNTMLTWQRSAFHFQPENNWQNDPNGPMYYKGWYHFFYQYNPNGAIWGDIVWGHAVSRNLIHWYGLPLAMVADQWYDANGVWTGSATILPDGKVIMLYTGSTNESVQVQNLAYPADPSDPLLVKWVKHPENPILFPPKGIHHKDFRDPTTAWLTSEGKWRITIGSKVNKTGISLVYDTKDFVNYTLLEKRLHGVDGTGMWECVDFYPVSKTSTEGLDTSVNGAEVKHVVKTSLDDTRNDHYSIGTYFEKNASWVPDDAKIDVGIGLRYDYGTFYASKTFYDESKKRRVLWGWITEADSETADVKKGWACLQSIPRTVQFDQKTGGNLIVWPVEEVERLRSNKKEFNVKIEPGKVVPLDVGLAAQLDIVAEFELDKEAMNRVTEENAEYSCGSSEGASQRGALGPFGFLVLADESLTEQTPVYFYIAKGSGGKLKTFFCTDKTRSSEATDVVKMIHGNFVPVLKGEKLSLRIMVDHSIVESFAQGGRSSITARIYPTKAVYGAAKVMLFNNATNTNVSTSVKIWHMNCAFLRQYPVDQINSSSNRKIGLH